MTSTGDQLVEEYLHRFDNASVFLTDERRAELRQEIVEHIKAGVEEAEAVHADAVRAALDRLGPPADIVASETGSGSTGPVPGHAPAPVVVQDSPPARGIEVAHHGGGHLPPYGDSAPVPPARPRKFSPLLIGGVVTAVVVGALAMGVSVSGSEPVPTQVERPSPTAPPQSDAPDSEGQNRPPESSPSASVEP